MRKQIGFTYMITLILLPCSLLAQKKQKIKLADLYKKEKIEAVNRSIRIISNDTGAYMNISESKKEGIVWLPSTKFKTGTIEIKMRGKNVYQRSFIGLAFHGLDNTNYEAVYCRPFNFFSTDSVRRIHSVQYISHPNFTWEKLRKERNSEFEKGISNPPNPDGWFTMKLSIDNTTVKAYINDSAEPSLIVKTLSKHGSGKIGLFTADSSGGDFDWIIISHKKT